MKETKPKREKVLSIGTLRKMEMTFEMMELPKNAEIWQILAKKLAYVRKLL